MPGGPAGDRRRRRGLYRCSMNEFLSSWARRHGRRTEHPVSGYRPGHETFWIPRS